MSEHKLNYTNEQLNIIEADINKNIIVESDAGCGKTFCIVKRAEYLVKNGIDQRKIQILAFNKAVASEIARKLQELKLYRVKVDTLDSFVLS
jgi:DNA helicase-2/ATP-dependent DNA helicase PcrA